jgi:membrane protein DedA with SNARE-associated domain
MSQVLEALKAHGYPLLFATVLAEQLGLPLPSTPVLLAAGALVGLGYLNWLPALLATVTAAVLADLVWFALGSYGGIRVLKFLCRLSIEPDHCVHSTEGSFERWGPSILLVAKFIPGVSTLAPPMASLSGIGVARFVLLDTLGSLLWAGVFGGFGWMLRDQLEHLIEWFERAGATLLQITLAVVAAHLAYRMARRWLFLRQLRTRRVTPQRLKELMDAGQTPYIVDLRQTLERQSDPEMIPGARVVSLEKLEELPRNRPMILYCS